MYYLCLMWQRGNTFKWMSAILLLLLTVLFTAKFIFFNAYVQSQKHTLREMAFKSNAEPIQVIYLNKEELFKDKIGYEWKDEFKEIKILNVFYEVVDICLVGNRYRVVLLEDKTETTMFLTWMQQDNSGSDYNYTSLVLSDFFLPQCNVWGNINFNYVSYTINWSPQLEQGYNIELTKPPIPLQS